MYNSPPAKKTQQESIVNDQKRNRRDCELARRRIREEPNTRVM